MFAFFLFGHWSSLKRVLQDLQGHTADSKDFDPRQSNVFKNSRDFKDFKAFRLTAESCPLPNPGIGRYPEAHRSYDKFIQRFPNGVCVTLSWDEARREDPKSCLDQSPLTAAPSSWACMCRWCPKRTPTLNILWCRHLNVLNLNIHNNEKSAADVQGGRQPLRYHRIYFGCHQS